MSALPLALMSPWQRARAAAADAAAWVFDWLFALGFLAVWLLLRLLDQTEETDEAASFIGGWRWGFVCGTCFGALGVAAALLVGWHIATA